MDDNCITDITCSWHDYNVIGHEQDDSMEDFLMQKKNHFHKMEELKALVFKPSIDILMNKKNGKVVLDDELIGSRTVDIENQSRSDWNTGRDGPVVNGIADSCSGC
jgi:hypothetical protein